jgi:hypothetical protein
MRIASPQRSISLIALASVSLSLATSAAPQGWVAATPTPVPVVRAAGVWFAPTGRFYAMGGRQTDVAGSDLMNPLEYNPSTGSWSVKAGTFPDNQNNNFVAGVLVEGGTPYIFCVGGSAAGAATSSTAVRRYDPVADVITVVATDPWLGPPANTLAGGGAVFNNKLYVIGGFTIGVGMSSQIWEFDPAAAPGARWTMKTSVLPVPVGYVPATNIGSKIYIAGGATFSAGLLNDSNGSYEYDPVADLLLPIVPIPRVTGETVAVNQGGRAWVLGGGRIAPNPSNQVDAYDPSALTWGLAPAMITARRNFAADVDPATGNVYVAGGYAPATPTNLMEIFVNCGATNNYCTAGTTSSGCVPAISGTGTPSASAASGFTIDVAAVEGQKQGLIFYGVTGPSAAVWGTGSSFLCVKAPTQRTPTQASNGTAGACDGALSIDFNTYISTHPGAVGQPFSSGDEVWAQGWFRDPPASKTTNLSDGLHFTMCP